MRIIKEGYDLTKEVKTICTRCMCEFTYMPEDIENICLTSNPPQHKSFVICPNKTCNSKIIISQTR